MIKNSMEEVVEILLQRLLNESPELFGCTCENCLNDIRTMTLNKVAPKYYSSDKGKIFTEWKLSESSTLAALQNDMVAAIMKVTDNPRHE
ncbi:MAG: late competence development ComFB family protein [Clostridia bacterium]|nr:late competence development ComFB family protein [Clostridia bacterium]